MAFTKETADKALVLCGRCCCLCHKYCGAKIELHHIVPEAVGGDDSLDNCIPLCFDCHADVGHYNSDHPKGRRFTAEELRSHRAKWHEQVKSLNDDINVPSAVTIQKVTGNRNIVAGRDVKIAEKFTTRVEVVPDPGGRHITDAEALQVKQAVAKYSELMKSAELSPNPSRVWGRLYDYFQVTSYKEIPFGRVEEALKIAHTEIAKVRPKIRRRNPEAWRNQYYTAVYAAAGSLSMSKEDVYAFAYEQLRLKKPIGSLKELTQKQLQELDRKMKQMTRG